MDKISHLNKSQLINVSKKTGINFIHLTKILKSLLTLLLKMAGKKHFTALTILTNLLSDHHFLHKNNSLSLVFYHANKTSYSTLKYLMNASLINRNWMTICQRITKAGLQMWFTTMKPLIKINMEMNQSNERQDYNQVFSIQDYHMRAKFNFKLIYWLILQISYNCGPRHKLNSMILNKQLKFHSLDKMRISTKGLL